jgi:hypothetical protein
MDVLAELADPAHITEGARYDTLVIAERHDLLLVIRWEDTVRYLRHFHDRVVEANDEARTFLFHAWLAIDKDAPQAWIDYERAAADAWACVASKVDLTLEDEGRDDRVEVLPAGAALVALVERVLAEDVPGITGASSRERLDAVFLDDVHLTPLGRYYVALVIYAFISGGSPEGAAFPDVVDPETAAALQSIAADFASAYRADAPDLPLDMGECRALATDLCAPFHALAGSPEQTETCEALYADESAPENPFRWPDPDFVPLPPP